MKKWHKVFAHQFDFDQPKGRRVLLAKFSVAIDANVYSDAVRKSNPTWHVEIEEGR